MKKMKIGRRMQENDALTMVLGFQNVSKSWDDSWPTYHPHTSDLQTGLTPQNQNSQVVVFCVLQSASLLTPGCPPRALAPHRWHSRLAQVWTKSELANCLAKFLSWFRRFYDESLPPQKHQESWISKYISNMYEYDWICMNTYVDICSVEVSIFLKTMVWVLIFHSSFTLPRDGE
jgi:hypothetical protein